MADIQLRINADFAQAEAMFKSAEAASESLRVKIEKLQQNFSQTHIDNFIAKNKLTAAALTATRGPAEAAVAAHREMRTEIERLIKAGLNPENENLKKLRLRYSELSKEIDSTAKKKSIFGDMGDSITKMLIPLATATTAVRAAKAAWDWSEEAAKFEQSTAAMEAQFGVSADVMLKKMRETSGGIVSDAKLIEGANKAMALGVTTDIDKMAELMEIARVKSRTMGTDATTAFDNLVTGIGRGSALILDNLGITVNGWEELAKAQGVTYDKQFILNQVLKQGGEELAKLGPLTMTNAEKFQMLDAQFENAKKSIGQSLMPVMTSLAETLATVLKGLEAVTSTTSHHARVVEKAGGAMAYWGITMSDDAASLKVLQTIEAQVVEEEKKQLEISTKAAAANKRRSESEKELAKSFSERLTAMMPLSKQGEQEQDIKAAKDFFTKRAELEAASTKDEFANGEARITFLKNQYAIINQMHFKSAEERKAIEAGLTTAMQEASNAQIDSIVNTVKSTVDGLMSIVGAVGNLMAAINKRELDELNARMNAELKAAGVQDKTQVEQARKELAAAKKTGNALEIEEAQRALTKAEIEEKYAIKRQNLEYSGAITAWKFQVAAATAAMGMAIMNAIAAGAKFGPVGMTAYAAMAATATGIQLAAVKAAKPVAPKAETGIQNYVVPEGRNTSNDRAAVMASGGESVTVTPRGEMAGGTTINIRIEEETIFSVVRKGIAMGRIDISNRNIGSGIFN